MVEEEVVEVEEEALMAMKVGHMPNIHCINGS